MTAKKREPGFKPLPSQDPDWDKIFNEPPVPKSPLEPDCIDATISLAISAKRQADALERIADILAKQTGLVEMLGDELRG